MSDEKLPLLASLLNPPAPSEPETAPVALVEDAAPSGERIELVDPDEAGEPKDVGYKHSSTVYNIPFTMGVDYYNGDQLVSIGMVDATLVAYHRQEDSSFDHAFGTHGGKYYEFEIMGWENPKIPHSAENYDLFQLDPAQVQHITEFVKKALTTMSHDDIEKHVDVEHWAERLAPTDDGP